LETQGVPVVGYRTDEFPAFYTRSSGLPVDVRCDTPAEIAAVVRARDKLGLQVGTLVTVPIPPEDELPAAEAEDAIGRALTEAEAQGVTGKEATPFLLARVNELTGEASLRANVALLLNNARAASAIAVALST
jgi:pseudouridine-5'-phosphate glycosidase